MRVLPEPRGVERFTASIASPKVADQDDLAAAQDLIYEAFESTGRKRVELARRALEISADCADAYGILAEETTRSLEERRDLYAAGVAAGERALGKYVFEQDAGSFWGLVETRPYMRVRAGLAGVLWMLGEREEAVGHYRDLVRLNPADNQGIRYLLVTCLLTLGRDVEAETLLDDPDYADDSSAAWVYARALLAFRQKGAGEYANGVLAEAQEMNPHVPAYLTGARRLPKRMPELVGLGDESEAVACASEQFDAWESTLGALGWLRRETSRHRGPARPSTRRVAVTSGPTESKAERRRWLFPEVKGTFDGIQPEFLDPAIADDRRFLILAEHRKFARAINRGDDVVNVEGNVVNPHLHIAMHEVVANQIWDGKPAEVWPTVARLRGMGYERHDILHMLASVVTGEIWKAGQSGVPSDPASYARALGALPESWHGDREED